MISKVTASPTAKFAALSKAGNVKLSKPPLADTELLVAMVVTPFFKTAVTFGLAGIDPVATE